MNIGTIVRFASVETVEEKFKAASDVGVKWCQLLCWEPHIMTEENAKFIISLCKKYDIQISTFWCGWSGPAVWNFIEGPVTLGIVPPEYRNVRVNELIHGSDFAKMLGVDKMATHLGFLPENMSDPNFIPVLSAIKYIGNHCKKNGQYFIFETGQETPVTLLRFIEESGLDNLGINLDPANLILYGKANPVDALTVFGKYVMDVHAKDGDYPTDSKNLGVQKRIGEGSVNFPALIAKLKEIGYTGNLTIEREINNDAERNKDTLDAKIMLEALI